MVSIEEINREILELEKRDTSYAVIERLSWLYTVRDHLRAAMVDGHGEATGRLGKSEFLTAASCVPVEGLMAVIDEHMDAIRIICPREYESVVAKIAALRQ